MNLGTPGATTPAKYHISGGVSVSGDWNIKGPVVIVTDGNFNVGNNTVTINLGGSLTVYVKGDINVVGNGGFNNSNQPETLQIFGINPYSQSLTSVEMAFFPRWSMRRMPLSPRTEAAVTERCWDPLSAIKSLSMAAPGHFHFDEALGTWMSWIPCMRSQSIASRMGLHPQWRIMPERLPIVNFSTVIFRRVIRNRDTKARVEPWKVPGAFLPLSSFLASIHN